MLSPTYAPNPYPNWLQANVNVLHVGGIVSFFLFFSCFVIFMASRWGCLLGLQCDSWKEFDQRLDARSCSQIGIAALAHFRSYLQRSARRDSGPSSVSQRSGQAQLGRRVLLCCCSKANLEVAVRSEWSGRLHHRKPKRKSNRWIDACNRQIGGTSCSRQVLFPFLRLNSDKSIQRMLPRSLTIWCSDSSEEKGGTDT